jgi:hypothetical protein
MTRVWTSEDREHTGVRGRPLASMVLVKPPPWRAGEAPAEWISDGRTDGQQHYPIAVKRVRPLPGA